MRFLKAFLPFLLVVALLYGAGFVARALAGPPLEPAGPSMTSPSFDLTWDVAEAGGGNTMTSSSFVLHSTTGQAAISNELSGPSFKLQSGYWSGVLDRIYRNLLPLLQRD